jgi:hypothetical protein
MICKGTGRKTRASERGRNGAQMEARGVADVPWICVAGVRYVRASKAFTGVRLLSSRG